jgi:hypothetical protein
MFRIGQSAAMGGWGTAIANGVIQGGSVVVGVLGTWFGRSNGTSGTDESPEIDAPGNIATTDANHESMMSEDDRKGVAQLQAKVEEFMVMQAEADNQLSREVSRKAKM